MNSISDIQEPKVGMIPVVRIRISTDFQASTKRIEPSVTVELVCPADLSVDEEALIAAVKLARAVAASQFQDALLGAEDSIARLRPAVGDKS